MATYGEGDPTDNAQEFYNWLQNGESDLTGVKFAVSTCKSIPKPDKKYYQDQK